jgi:hypothetical protein
MNRPWRLSASNDRFKLIRRRGDAPSPEGADRDLVHRFPVAEEATGAQPVAEQGAPSARYVRSLASDLGGFLRSRRVSVASALAPTPVLGQRAAPAMKVDTM